MSSHDKDHDPSTGSGDGGTLGTPTTDNVEDVPSNDGANMVVSGGGVADTSQADREATSRPGLRETESVGDGRGRTPAVLIGLAIFAIFLILLYVLG